MDPAGGDQVAEGEFIAQERDLLLDGGEELVNGALVLGQVVGVEFDDEGDVGEAGEGVGPEGEDALQGIGIIGEAHPVALVLAGEEDEVLVRDGFGGNDRSTEAADAGVAALAVGGEGLLHALVPEEHVVGAERQDDVADQAVGIVDGFGVGLPAAQDAAVGKPALVGGENSLRQGGGMTARGAAQAQGQAPPCGDARQLLPAGGHDTTARQARLEGKEDDMADGKAEGNGGERLGNGGALGNALQGEQKAARRGVRGMCGVSGMRGVCVMRIGGGVFPIL